MAEVAPRSLEKDPPPTPRDRERLIWLAFAIAAPPALWNLQLLVLSSFSNYACFPANLPLAVPVSNMTWTPTLDYAVDAIAIAISIAGFAVSLSYFRLARERLQRFRDGLSLWHLDRLCFMAIGGMLSSGGFLIAIVFETIATIMVPPCAG